MAIPQKRKRRQQGLRLLALLAGRTASVPVPQPHPQQVQRNATGSSPEQGADDPPAGDSGKAPSREESGESGDRNPADVAYGREVPQHLAERETLGARREIRKRRVVEHAIPHHGNDEEKAREPDILGERVRHIPHAVRAGDQAQRTQKTEPLRTALRAQARQCTQQGRNRQDDPRVLFLRAKSDDHERQQNGHAVIQSVHDHMENLQQCGGPVRKKTHVEPLVGWNPFAFQRIAYCSGSYVDDRAGSAASRA